MESKRWASANSADRCRERHRPRFSRNRLVTALRAADGATDGATEGLSARYRYGVVQVVCRPRCVTVSNHAETIFPFLSCSPVERGIFLVMVYWHTNTVPQDTIMILRYGTWYICRAKV